MIKVVFMDIDNTLLDFNASAAQAMKMAFNKHGLIYSDAFFPVFKKINDELWLGIEKKRLTRDELYAVRFNLIFSELGIVYDGRKVEKDFLESLNECAVKVEGAENIAEYLSGKYILCSASNAPKVQQRKRLAFSGLGKYFHKTFISEELGYNKPDARFFDKCFEALSGIDASEAVMVGDSLSADVAGGKNYGMKTVWFNPYGAPYENSADYTVTKLSDIKRIL